VENRLGEEGQGFKYLVTNLPQERLSIACAAIAAATCAFEMTLAYVKERKAFGQPIGSFQNTKFVLAELATEISIGQQYLDNCITAHNQGELTAAEASAAKWWCTELQGRTVDKCVQLHGGYGYMTEHPITRAYANARITRIYGGTTEIMKEVVGRSLGL
jgi:alkylation response protein AidB-like acyl-CoA dehydrogenase